MHWLDFVLLLVLGIGAFLGARSGLLWQIARIVTFGIAVYACIHYHAVAANFLVQNVQGLNDLTTRLLAYLVTFLGVCLGCFLVTYLLEKGLRAAKLKPIDRVLGALVGILKSGLLAGAVLMGFALYAPGSDQTLRESKVATPLLEGMRLVIVAVPQQYKDSLSETLDRLRKDGIEKIKQEQVDQLEKKVDQIEKKTKPKTLDEEIDEISKTPPK